MSHATCFMRPRLLCFSSRQGSPYVAKYSPILKKTCVRQAVLDKSFPPNTAIFFPFASTWRSLLVRAECPAYGQFSKFHVCFCGLDSGNLKFETVRTNKQRICFSDLRRSIKKMRFEIMKTDRILILFRCSFSCRLSF